MSRGGERSSVLVVVFIFIDFTTLFFCCFHAFILIFTPLTPDLYFVVPLLSPLPYRYANGEVVVVDNVLSEWAIQMMHDFLLEATIFWEGKLNGKYLGAYSYFGLYGPMHQRITDDFRQTLSEVVGNRELVECWSYKYLDGITSEKRDGGGGSGSGTNQQQQQTGVPPHADLAEVNLNLWITPDAANLDATQGGLDVYKYRVSTRAEFNKFQAMEFKDGEQTNEVLSSEKISVPYKRNRMVLFNSDLVHATQPLRFHGGYKNRRINLTWLFGHPDWIKEKDRKNEEHLRFATNFVNRVFPPSKKAARQQVYNNNKQDK